MLLSLRIQKLEFAQYCWWIIPSKLCHVMMDKGRQVVIQSEKQLSLQVTVMK